MLWDLRFWHQCFWRFMSSGMLRCIVGWGPTSPRRLLDPEDWDATVLRNIGNCSHCDTALYPRTVWIRKTNQMSLFVFFISLLIVAQHVSGNHVRIIRSWRPRDVIASCWYVPWLREGCQDRLAPTRCHLLYSLFIF